MGREGGTDSRRAAAGRYAEWVREQMGNRKWNQSRLANRAGLHPNVVSAIVKGAAVQPAPEQIAAVARAFGVTPNDVMREAGWWEGQPDDELPIPFEIEDALRHSRLVTERLEAYLGQREDSPGEEGLGEEDETPVRPTGPTPIQPETFDPIPIDPQAAYDREPKEGDES